MKLTRQDYILAGGQALLWITLWLIPPAIDFFIRFNPSSAFEVWKINTGFITPLAIVFTANFYVLVPYLLYRDRKMLFGLMNLLLITGANLWIFSPKADFPDEWRSGMYMVAFGAFFLHLLVVGCAVGFRYIVRWGDMQMRLKEERQKNAEAELAWLKNQLNPHFLFNTLNNISSLVQIDQDTAQESIGQLSDLLRYTLYESNHELVPVEGEIEFMNNYIELMRLRCNELATVEVDLQIPIKPMRIVPLLFISLIENAFKHGVNSRKSSFVRIRFKAEGDDLVFTCENSDHPKPDVNRSGSGIGLENLRRRLDLAYPGRYRYDQALRGNSYFVQITLPVKMLEDFVSRTPYLRLAASFNDPVLALSTLRESSVDVLFLDIQMPDLDGLNLSRMVPPGTRVIFTTAFKEYAFDSYEVNALDFLLKPIRYHKFLGAAEKARQWFEMSSVKEERGSLFVRVDSQLRQVEISRILYVTGLKDYVMIYLEGEARPLITHVTMKAMEEMLSTGRFMRVHRSYIVALDKIRSVDRNNCVYIGKEIIHVTDAYKEAFNAYLKAAQPS